MSSVVCMECVIHFIFSLNKVFFFNIDDIYDKTRILTLEYFYQSNYEILFDIHFETSDKCIKNFDLHQFTKLVPPLVSYKFFLCHLVKEIN